MDVFFYFWIKQREQLDVRGFLCLRGREEQQGGRDEVFGQKGFGFTTFFLFFVQGVKGQRSSWKIRLVLLLELTRYMVECLLSSFVDSGRLFGYMCVQIVIQIGADVIVVRCFRIGCFVYFLFLKNGYVVLGMAVYQRDCFQCSEQFLLIIVLISGYFFRRDMGVIQRIFKYKLLDSFLDFLIQQSFWFIDVELGYIIYIFNKFLGIMG